MAKTRLSEVAKYVERGYGQVEPNHLSAKRTGQIYAQLPADADIKILENGQFAKYDYEKGVVNFEGKGEWMLVYNEIKLYRDGLSDHDFALKAEDYHAFLYSPIDGDAYVTNGVKSRDYSKVVTPADPYEMDSTDDPFKVYTQTAPKAMIEGTRMVPRLFKTNIGDIFTTNCVVDETLAVGEELVVGDNGYLTKTPGENSGEMKWQVVKVYTLPDHQKAVKIMRIA